ncbi:MAG: NUDIX domain-containing protein [Chitinispirillaceae bacterium]|nr:NUDIX domain-containing protein [Chitinispirillaceae bacterium]
MKKYTHFRYCPRCASPKIKVHMKNAIKCGACGYVYFHNTAAAVAGIIEINGKVLFIKRATEPKKGFYDLPGGFVDYKESIEAALKREVKEECNLGITDLRWFGSFGNRYRYGGVDYFTADAFFLCRPVNFKKLRISKEASAIKMIDVKNADFNKIAFESIRKALKKYNRRVAEPVPHCGTDQR